MKPLLCLLSVCLLTACSSLNPFASRITIPPLPADTGSQTVKSLWSVSVGAPGMYELEPARLEAAVFAASHSGRISRIEKGIAVWQIDTGVKLSAGVGVSAGRLVVGTDKGDVLAFSLEGKPLWRVKLNGEILAAPTVDDAVVLVRTTDNRIFALEAADGKRRWTYQRSSPALVIRNAGGITLDRGVAYAGFPGGKLVALNLSNGGALWEASIANPRGATELERVADVAGEPVVMSRGVCAVAFQGRLACVDRTTGANLWSRELSSASGLTHDERTLFVSDEKGNVFAFDAATGATMWKQEQLAGRSPSRPALVGDGVAVVDVEGYVHVLRSSDGAFRGRANGRSRTFSAPLGASDQLLVLDADGSLSAFALQ